MIIRTLRAVYDGSQYTAFTVVPTGSLYDQPNDEPADAKMWLIARPRDEAPASIQTLQTVGIPARGVTTSLDPANVPGAPIPSQWTMVPMPPLRYAGWQLLAAVWDLEAVPKILGLLTEAMIHEQRMARFTPASGTVQYEAAAALVDIRAELCAGLPPATGANPNQREIDLVERPGT